MHDEHGDAERPGAPWAPDPGMSLAEQAEMFGSIAMSSPTGVVVSGVEHEVDCIIFASGFEVGTPFTERAGYDPERGGLIFARRWCWKQSLESSASLSSTAALITIEAHHPAAERDVRAAMEDLTSLLGLYAGGSFRSIMLGGGKDNQFRF